jgi:hypothetical protein
MMITILAAAIGIWPAGFDDDAVLYCNTAYGDYPHYVPQSADQDHLNGMFAGWMLPELCEAGEGIFNTGRLRTKLRRR